MLIKIKYNNKTITTVSLPLIIKMYAKVYFYRFSDWMDAWRTKLDSHSSLF